MTDKVQKIREEVEKIARSINPYIPDEEGKNSEYEAGRFAMVTQIMQIIDSMQEEPVSVWHNASEEPNDMSHCLIFYGFKESVGHYLHYEPVLYNKKDKVFVTPSFSHPTGYKVEQKSIDGGCVAEVYKNKRDRISISDITQWCYLCDLHNLSNVERIGKDLKEEPVSEKKCMFTKEEFTEEDRKILCEDCEEECEYAKKEEPVSEDLEDAAYNWVMDNFGNPKESLFTFEQKCFKAGAQWQKEQDQSTIELAEEHAMLAGMNKMEEQMMANATDMVVGYWMPNGLMLTVDEAENCYNIDEGDRVKVIVIKED